MKTGVSHIIPSAGRLYKLYDVTYSYLGGPSLFMFSNSRSVVWVKIGAVSWSRMCELRSSGNTFWWRERALFNWTLALFPLFFCSYILFTWHRWSGMAYFYFFHLLRTYFLWKKKKTKKLFFRDPTILHDYICILILIYSYLFVLLNNLFCYLFIVTFT